MRRLLCGVLAWSAALGCAGGNRAEVNPRSSLVVAPVGSALRPVMASAPMMDAGPVPPLDSDGDGIPDEKDSCPNEAENRNGCYDDDGCPDKIVVVPKVERLEFVDTIPFATGSARLRLNAPEVISSLGRLLEALQANPQATPIEVQGHAADDERRPDELSGRRATAVATYLIAHGVGREQLVIRRLGAGQAPCPRTDEECLGRKRRVELVVPEFRRPPATKAGPRDCLQVLL